MFYFDLVIVFIVLVCARRDRRSGSVVFRPKLVLVLSLPERSACGIHSVFIHFVDHGGTFSLMVNNTTVNNGYDENEPRWGKISSGAQTERERVGMMQGQDTYIIGI